LTSNLTHLHLSTHTSGRHGARRSGVELTRATAELLDAFMSFVVHRNRFSMLALKPFFSFDACAVTEVVCGHWCHSSSSDHLGCSRAARPYAACLLLPTVQMPSGAQSAFTGARVPARTRSSSRHVAPARVSRVSAVRAQASSKAVKKVVLAYSGGLDTSVILKWLQDTYNCEVVTFTADLGQVRAWVCVGGRGAVRGTPLSVW
jgi:hypothetical protein